MSDIKDIVLLWLGRYALKLGRYFVQQGGGIPTACLPSRLRRACECGLRQEADREPDILLDLPKSCWAYAELR